MRDEPRAAYMLLSRDKPSGLQSGARLVADVLRRIAERREQPGARLHGIFARAGSVGCGCEKRRLVRFRALQRVGERDHDGRRRLTIRTRECQ